jgi:hypothetical protein
LSCPFSRSRPVVHYRFNGYCQSGRERWLADGAGALVVIVGLHQPEIPQNRSLFRRLTTFKTEPAVSASITKTMKCLNPDCTRDATIRGLCKRDYAVACRERRAGRTTFTELVKQGRMLTPQTSTGRQRGQTAKWLTENHENS